MPCHRFTLIVLATLLVCTSVPFRLHAAGATLGVSASVGAVPVGDTFTVRVVVNAPDQAINAAEATLSFPRDLVEATGVSKSGSIFTLWTVEPASSNASGTVRFAGGLPSPGFRGTGGRIVTVTFRAKATGSAKFTLSGGRVLANDGRGTNILASVGSATVKLTEETAPAPTRAAPVITSSTHPDPSRWYAVRDARATWSASPGVRGYSAVFDQSSATVPTEQSEGLGNSFARTNLADGAWYLHVRAQYADGWSVTRHHAFRVDTSPPQGFTPTVSVDPATRSVTVTFAATDVPSGIARYELSIDGGALRDATSPVTLSNLSPGDHVVLVRALDQAGNVTEGQASVSLAGPSAPTVRLDLEGINVVGVRDDRPILTVGSRLKLRGYARPDDRIRIVVRSTESVFEFPVSDIVDPAPIEPAPPGLTAWRVEIRPDLAPGEHTIQVTALDRSGVESAAAPVIKILVVTNVLKVGSTYVPHRLLFLALGALAVLFFLTTLLFAWLWIRGRRRTHRTSRRSGA